MNSRTLTPMFAAVLTLAVSPTRALAQDVDAAFTSCISTTKLCLQSVQLSVVPTSQTFNNIDATNGWKSPVVTGANGESVSVVVSVITPGQNWKITQKAQKAESNVESHASNIVNFVVKLPAEEASTNAVVSSSLPGKGEQASFGISAASATNAYSQCIGIDPGCTQQACGPSFPGCKYSSSATLTDTLGLPAVNTPSSGGLNELATGSAYDQTMTTDVGAVCPASATAIALSTLNSSSGTTEQCGCIHVDVYLLSTVEQGYETPTISAQYKAAGGMKLSQIANACGYDQFDWQQKITNLPCPSPFELTVPSAVSPENRCSYLNPNVTPDSLYVGQPLFAVSDPAPGGYTDIPDYNPNPYYYYPVYAKTINKALYIGGVNHNPFAPNGTQVYVNSNDLILTFSDRPIDPCFPPGVATSRCGNKMDQTGSYIQFYTGLVGIKNGTPTVLAWWTWKDTYNGHIGSITRLTHGSNVTFR